MKNDEFIHSLDLSLYSNFEFSIRKSRDSTLYIDLKFVSDSQFQILKVKYSKDIENQISDITNEKVSVYNIFDFFNMKRIYHVINVYLILMIFMFPVFGMLNNSDYVGKPTYDSLWILSICSIQINMLNTICYSQQNSYY